MAKTGTQKPSTARAPTTIDKQIGARLRVLRHAAGLSQTELANVGGITFQQVQKYENGVNRLSSGRLHQFAAALGTTPAYLIGGTVQKPANTIIERMLAHHHGHKLAAAFLSIADVKVQADIALFVFNYAEALDRKAFREAKKGVR